MMRVFQFAVAAVLGACMLAPVNAGGGNHCFGPFDLFEEVNTPERTTYNFETADLSKCASVELTGLRFHDEGFVAITEAISLGSTITQLHLSNNGIKDLSVRYFAEVLEKNTHIADLDLNYNRITDVGAEALYNALLKNQYCRKINLADNNISPEWQKKLLSLNGLLPGLAKLTRKVIIEEQGDNTVVPLAWDPNDDPEFMNEYGEKYKKMLIELEASLPATSGPLKWYADAKAWGANNGQTLLAIVGILNLLFMAKQSMGGGNGGGGDKPAVKKDN